jgi:hypothetical protein
MSKAHHKIKQSNHGHLFSLVINNKSKASIPLWGNINSHGLFQKRTVF